MISRIVTNQPMIFASQRSSVSGKNREHSRQLQRSTQSGDQPLKSNYGPMVVVSSVFVTSVLIICQLLGIKSPVN